MGLLNVINKTLEAGQQFVPERVEENRARLYIGGALLGFSLQAVRVATGDMPSLYDWDTAATFTLTALGTRVHWLNKANENQK